MRMKKNHHKHRQHKYTNLALVGIGLGIALVLSRIESLHTLLLHVGNLGYIGAFIGGMLFVSTFTVATGSLILFYLAETLSPVEIGLIAGAGAVAGDLIIFRFVKDDLVSELTDLYHHFGGRHFSHLLHTPYFRWTLPVIGALIIASPLPDEVGVSLMGISKMSTLKFILISFLLNSAGIYIVILLSTLVPV